MERGIGAVLTDDLREQAERLRELLADVEAAQANLLYGIVEAHEAGMPLRAIAHNVGANHERVRRAIARDINVKPF